MFRLRQDILRPSIDFGLAVYYNYLIYASIVVHRWSKVNGRPEEGLLKPKHVASFKYVINYVVLG
jgi:hypothetical protein